MTSLLRHIFLYCLLFFAALQQAHAGGWRTFEYSAVATALAGAVITHSSDPSALVYNPALLSHLAGTQFIAGAQLVRPEHSLSGLAPFPGFGTLEQSRDLRYVPAHLFASQQINDRLVAAIGFYTPFWRRMAWEEPRRFSGRYLVQQSEFSAYALHPSAAFRLNEKLSLGLGLRLSWNRFRLIRTHPTLINGVIFDTAEFQLSENSPAEVTLNAGLHYTLSPRLQLALAFRPLQTRRLEAVPMTIRQLPTGNSELDTDVQRLLPQQATATLQMVEPLALAAGATWRLSARLVAHVNLEWLRAEGERDLVLEFRVDSVATQIVQGWHHSLNLRTGTEFRLRPSVRLMAGYGYLPSPQPTTASSPLLVDSDRHQASLGARAVLGRLTIDTAMALLFYHQRRIEDRNGAALAGVYEASQWQVALSFGYHFGKESTRE